MNSLCILACYKLLIKQIWEGIFYQTWKSKIGRNVATSVSNPDDLIALL